MCKKYDGVEIASVSFGRGVFATRGFDAGEIVGDIEGKVIDDPDYSSDYCIDLGDSLSMEPAPPFRFLNHSCEPNCELYLWDDSSGRKKKSRPRLIVEAIRPIQPGEQITIDYAWSAENAIPCCCGSKKCRGWIVDQQQLKNVEQQLVENQSP